MDGAALQVDGQPGQIGQGLQGCELQGGDIQLPKITAFPDAEGFQHLADARLRHLIVALDVDDPDPSRQELQQQRIDKDAGGDAGPCPVAVEEKGSPCRSSTRIRTQAFLARGRSFLYCLA